MKNWQLAVVGIAGTVLFFSDLFIDYSRPVRLIVNFVGVAASIACFNVYARRRGWWQDRTRR